MRSASNLASTALLLNRDEFFSVRSYRSGNRKDHYISPHQELTLVTFLGYSEENHALLECIRELQSDLALALPGVYWSIPSEALHVTLRAIQFKS